MNYYIAISEELISGGYGYSPPESYRIYYVVKARNRSSAIYKAWKKDSSYTGSLKDKPKFSCRKANLQSDEDFMEVFDAMSGGNYIGDDLDE